MELDRCSIGKNLFQQFWTKILDWIVIQSDCPPKIPLSFSLDLAPFFLVDRKSLLRELRHLWLDCLDFLFRHHIPPDQKFWMKGSFADYYARKHYC